MQYLVILLEDEHREGYIWCEKRLDKFIEKRSVSHLQKALRFWLDLIVLFFDILGKNLFPNAGIIALYNEHLSTSVFYWLVNVIEGLVEITALFLVMLRHLLQGIEHIKKFFLEYDRKFTLMFCKKF
jgi:hypothetical protein